MFFKQQQNKGLLIENVYLKKYKIFYIIYNIYCIRIIVIGSFILPGLNLIFQGLLIHEQHPVF